jgi:hypothetical protein
MDEKECVARPTRLDAEADAKIRIRAWNRQALLPAIF